MHAEFQACSSDSIGRGDSLHLMDFKETASRRIQMDEKCLKQFDPDKQQQLSL